ncbi:hypothetical protein GDO78_003123 [Eleutherodactylus coqui]|uniref:Uncharacterized protein n=1 Tax=Eleutherodactylus coqui TaxID=57060 RepID=A0A8J6K5S2_ELECQ|nr:hypothetical protein GDO78_003123 [Eleutherodactylus coqui]
MNCRTNTGRRSGYLTRRKIFKKQKFSYSYLSREKYIQWILLYDKKYIMPYTLQDRVTEESESRQSTSIVHTNEKLYFYV